MKATRSGCGQRWGDHAGKKREHEEDVRIAQERAKTKYIGIKVKHRDNHRKRPQLAKNPLMTFIKGPNGRLRRCTAEEWDHKMRSTRQKLRGYRDEKGKWHKRAPIGASLVTTYPAWSDVISQEAYKNLPRVVLFLLFVAQLMADIFEAQTGREVLGVALHMDSRALHFDIAHTRQTADERLLGHKAIGIAGLDTIAELRNAKYGAIRPEAVSVSEAKHRLNREFERGYERAEANGGVGVAPAATDYHLSEALDKECEREFGGSQYRQAAFAAYKVECSITPKMKSLAATRDGVEDEMISELVNMVDRNPGVVIPGGMLPGAAAIARSGEKERHMLTAIMAAEAAGALGAVEAIGAISGAAEGVSALGGLGGAAEGAGAVSGGAGMAGPEVAAGIPQSNAGALLDMLPDKGPELPESAHMTFHPSPSISGP